MKDELENAGIAGLTTAEQVAARFEYDGLSFTDRGGVSLEEACAAEGGVESRARLLGEHGETLVLVSVSEQIYDRIRWLFPDGSAIVAAGDAWDVEGETPFSWESQGA